MVPLLIQLIDAKCTKAAVNLILDGCDVNEYDTWGRSPVFAAVASKQLDLVELLLSKGCDPNAVLSGNSISPLMHALRTFVPDSDDDAIIMALVKNGANVNARTTGGMSVYEVASCSTRLPKSLKIVLLMHGAHATALRPQQTGNVSVVVDTAQAAHQNDRDFVKIGLMPKVKGTVEVTVEAFIN